jgi:class 3 adenylate cyclase
MGLHDTLLAVRPEADFDLIQRAYEVAARSHQGQVRMSGDPYISHPVMVATIMAGLEADGPTLCAAILHDTVEYTPFTLTALRREFGAEVASLVAEHMALDDLRRRRRLTADQILAAIGSADSRAVTLKMADRLHNMRTLEFLAPPKQLRKAREVLDIFAPVAEELCLSAIGSELETLAFGTLIRNQPARSPTHRTIVALDIERSTTRPDPVKAELRIMLYELFDAALRSAGIYPEHRDRFEDRGDGLLALLHPVETVPAALLLSRVVPLLARRVDTYNAGLPPGSRRERQLRIRVVVHAGEVNYDGHGCFGAALDTAFRLLDAPAAKEVLAAAPGPLLLVVSEDSYRAVVRHGLGMNLGPCQRQISVQVGHEGRLGRVFLPK